MIWRPYFEFPGFYQEFDQTRGETRHALMERERIAYGWREFEDQDRFGNFCKEVGPHFGFECDEDMVAFKLKWC